MTQVLRTLQGDATRTATQPAFLSGRVRRGESPRRILQAGEHLFEAGDTGSEAFILRTGHLKSYRIHRDGEEQILGMHGPGDVLGFETLTGRPASCSVVALEIASIEVIDMTRAGLESGHARELVQLFDGMHRELQRYARLLYMDRHPAERRLAEFLLDFSREQGEGGRSRSDLILPLNRRDLARYLGLAPETLSRTFSRFQDQGVLLVHNRAIHVLDHAALRSAALE